MADRAPKADRWTVGAPGGKLREPGPLWPEAPRYCPGRKLPAYRFVPGLNPHPVRDRRGHSFGRPEAIRDRIPPDRWRENLDYLFGIDLYHQGYFWEAHEVWEGLWKQADRDTAEKRFYQGLIFLTASQFKRHQGSAQGVRKASRLGYLRLEAVVEAGACDARGRFMGIDLPGLLVQIERYYGAQWPDGSLRGIALRGEPPRLMVEME